MFSNLSSESHTQPQQLNDKQQAMKLKLQQWNNNPPKIWGILTNTSKNERKKNGWIYSCANISCIKQHYSIEFGKYLQVRATEHWPGLDEAFL